MPSIEVILAAYNSPDFVAATIEGYRAQLDPDFCLAIADDGSGPEIREIVERAAVAGLRIRHEWHEDRGFRKSRIVNRAIASSAADFILLSDSDCVPGPHFIADHRKWAVPGRLSCGRRIELGPEITAGLLGGAIPISKLGDPSWLVSRDVIGQLDRSRYAIRFPEPVVRWWSRPEWGGWGSNMGVWREDLLRVNGFDNDFEGWGAEDVDLERRLEAAGCTAYQLRGRAVLFHLHHARREVAPKNRDLLNDTDRSGQWRARNGIVDES